MANRNIFSGGGDLSNPNDGRFAKAVAAASTALTWIFPVGNLDNGDFEMSWTGTLKGVFTLLMTDSYRQSLGINSAPTVVQAGNFTDISTTPGTYPVVKVWGTQPSGSNATGSCLRISAFQIPANCVEILYTPDGTTPGTGTITGYASIKGF